MRLFIGYANDYRDDPSHCNSSNIKKPDKGLSSIVNRLKFWKNKPAKTASICEGDDTEDTDVVATRKEITSGQS